MNDWEKWIVSELDRHFPDPKVPLHFKDGYTLLIAVLLSAQCTDKKVNQITPLLFSLADTPEKMVQLGQETIQKIIRPIGLFKRKSEAIFKLSEILIQRFSSNIPDTLEELMSLPGVGRKTALVLMAQWFHVPSFPVDTHIIRLSHRWKLSEKKEPEGVEQDLMRVFPKELWNRLHLQIIFAGRTFCKAAPHDKGICPICSKT